MWDLDYMDEYVLEECKKSFKKIYPEFISRPLGVSQDKMSVIFECDFPDGTFYFRVTENSVSHSYRIKEDADRD